MGLSARTPARELTFREAEDRREVCFQLEVQVKNACVDVAASTWALARALHEFDEAAGWVALGHEKLTDWLAQPDIGIKKAWYYQLIRAHRTLVVSRKVQVEVLDELDPSKVCEVVPAIEAGRVTLDEALADVRTMGWRDLREEYRQSDPAPPAGDEAAVSGGPEERRDESHVGDPVPLDLAAEDVIELWLALLGELQEAERSGQDQPRISAALIAPGVAGLFRVLDELAAASANDDQLRVERLVVACAGGAE